MYFIIFFFLNPFYIYGNKLGFEEQTLIDIRKYALKKLSELEKEINLLNQKIANENDLNKDIKQKENLEKELENIKTYNVVLLKTYTNGQTTKTTKE